MGDLINGLRELLSLMPSFPGWLRWLHYAWILVAFGAAFTTVVWYTSPSTTPMRVQQQARSRQPAGIPVELQSESVETLKRRIRELQVQGLDHMQRGEFEDAIESFKRSQIYLNQALIRAPEDLHVQNLRGYMLKDWAQVSLFLGQEAEAHKLLDEAARAFRLVLRGRPDDLNDASAHNGLGSVHAIRGDLDRAEQEIRTALRLAPDYEAAKRDLELVQQLRSAER